MLFALVSNFPTVLPQPPWCTGLALESCAIGSRFKVQRSHILIKLECSLHLSLIEVEVWAASGISL